MEDISIVGFDLAKSVFRCWQTNANQSLQGQGAVPYSAQRPRHSARAAARLTLKFCRLERLRS